MSSGFRICSPARLISRSRPTLDGTVHANELTAVETPAIKVLGQLRKTPWQRFARLQRTTAKLAKSRGQPKGVFRFATNEACDAWTATLNRRTN